MLDFSTLCWLFVAAVAAHNLEEAIWLPDWSRAHAQWVRPLKACAFRFALIVLTLLAVVCA